MKLQIAIEISRILFSELLEQLLSEQLRFTIDPQEEAEIYENSLEICSVIASEFVANNIVNA